MSNTQPVNHQLSLSWVVPDGLNRKLEDIETKTIANFASPGGGTGAMLVKLPALQPYYYTEHYLVDFDTGELFAQRHRLWYTTGLTCRSRQFSPNEVDERIQRESERYRQKLEEEEQTEVIPIKQDTTQYLKLPTPIQSKQNMAILPNLPNLPDPSCFRIFTDVMQLQTRKNYLRDRRLAASSYILEYGATKIMAGNGQYDVYRLNQRLRIVFGKAEAIRRNIDTSLMQDDYHRRRRNMRALGVPTRFPEPSHMENSPTNKWIHSINVEAENLQKEINEEIKQVQDPDDPFDGTAGGVFQPLVQDLTEARHNTENNKIPTMNEDSQVSEIEKEQNTLPLSQTLIDIGFDTAPQHTPVGNRDPNVNRQLIPNVGMPERLQPTTNLATRLPTTPTQNTTSALNNGGEGATPRETDRESNHEETPKNEQEVNHTPPREPPPERCEPSQPPQHNERVQEQQNINYNHQYEQTLKEKEGYNQPSYNQQGYNQPSYNQPSYNQPSYNQPGYKVLSYNQPGYNQPSYNQTNYNQPKPDPHQRQQYNNMTTYGNRNPTYENPRQRRKDEENDACGRCGEEGHYQENCYAYVKCDFCHVRTHNTIACRSYKNFVKAHPIASSRRNTPVNGYNAQKENKQGSADQYKPQTQIRKDYNEEADYRTIPHANQSNLHNRQNQIAPNASTTGTYNKVHPNIMPQSYVQEQPKKELNQSQTRKQTHHNQTQVEKSAPTRTLSNETHQELYQAILKHLQESTNKYNHPNHK